MNRLTGDCERCGDALWLDPNRDLCPACEQTLDHHTRLVLATAAFVAAFWVTVWLAWTNNLWGQL